MTASTILSAETTSLDVATVVRDPERLNALRETGLLDSEAEESFDQMTRLAVRILGVPAAFISLVDENRDFYKSACGFGEPLASAREMSGVTFCHYAIGADQPLVIDDTRADPVYRTVPTVESLGVAAYVGIPLADPRGHILGAFCAIDFAPRQWSETEIQVLTELATSARREIALRERARVAEAQAAELQVFAADLQTSMDDLRESHWQIRRIQKYLPVCMGCQKVRETPVGESEWRPLTSFLAANGLLMSHGYCPPCENAALAEVDELFSAN